MKKKKLLFIIWSFTYGGGAEKLLANLVNKMDFNKYEIDVIEYWHSNINSETTNENVNILKPIVDSTKASKIEKLTKKILLEHFPLLLRTKYIKKKYDFEISFNSMIPTFLLSKKSKNIAWIHGDMFDLKNRKYDYKLQKNSFRKVNKIVAISENTYKSIVKIFPEYKNKTVIINNSFDFEKIDMLSKESIDYIHEEFTLLFAGRFDENKNPLFMIEVAKLLKEKGQKFRLLFIGKGNLETEMKEKIKIYQLEDYVKIIGFKSNPYPYFKLTDIVVMSSRHEGFPTVLSEGLSLGKPFISTKVGGTDELSANGKYGFVENNIDQYVNCIIDLINDKKLYKKMSNNGLNYIRKFTFENQIRKFETLMEDIYNESKN